jgi:hypothetical protein
VEVDNMPSKVLFALATLLMALNVIVLGINSSRQSKAVTAGANYQDLIHDADFTRAVKSIAEACTVNVDIARLRC